MKEDLFDQGIVEEEISRELTDEELFDLFIVPIDMVESICLTVASNKFIWDVKKFIKQNPENENLQDLKNKVRALKDKKDELTEFLPIEKFLESIRISV